MDPESGSGWPKNLRIRIRLWIRIPNTVKIEIHFYLYLCLASFLVEWLELLTSLGANKVFLYNLEVHPNVTKVNNF
jgi:hypothetical protein